MRAINGCAFVRRRSCDALGEIDGLKDALLGCASSAAAASWDFQSIDQVSGTSGKGTPKVDPTRRELWKSTDAHTSLLRQRARGHVGIASKLIASARRSYT